MRIYWGYQRPFQGLHVSHNSWMWSMNNENELWVRQKERTDSRNDGLLGRRQFQAVSGNNSFKRCRSFKIFNFVLLVLIDSHAWTIWYLPVISHNRRSIFTSGSITNRRSVTKALQHQQGKFTQRSRCQEVWNRSTGIGADFWRLRLVDPKIIVGCRCERKKLCAKLLKMTCATNLTQSKSDALRSCKDKANWTRQSVILFFTTQCCWTTRIFSVYC